MDWRTVFRRGLAPSLTDAGLLALRNALRDDSPQLIQGGNVSPPPVWGKECEPPEAACPLGYALWKGLELTTVEAVHNAVANLFSDCDERVVNQGGCVGNFVGWFDNGPREHFFGLLLAEVEAVLAERLGEAGCKAFLLANLEEG